MSPVLGVRPVAASTSSAVTCVPSSSVSVTGPSPSARFAAVTCTPGGARRRPPRGGPSATSEPAKRGAIRSSNSSLDTSVTREPSADHAAAISHPTTPAPRRWPAAAAPTFALVALPARPRLDAGQRRRHERVRPGSDDHRLPRRQRVVAD